VASVYNESACRVVVEWQRVALRDCVAPPTRKVHIRRRPHSWTSNRLRQVLLSRPRNGNDLDLSVHARLTLPYAQPQGHVRIAG
jgi:hypothetical protein